MKKIMIILLGALILNSACNKSYVDINQNQNQPTQVTPNVVLSSALVGTASNLATDYLGLTRWMGYWSRSGNYVPDVQTETYNIANDYTDAEWNNLYLNLNNYHYIELTGEGQNLPFYIGVAKTMKAYVYSILVDMYNDVPYFQSSDINTNVTPAFDAGQIVYTDLVSQLDSAIDYFEVAKTYYAGAAATIVSTDDQYDVLFGSARTGDADPTNRMIRWQKLANTFKLRLLLNQSQVAAGDFITTEIAKTKDIGYIGAGETASVNPGYQASTGKANPFYGQFYTVTGSATVTQNYYRANCYAVHFYENTGDIRQAYFYTGYTLTPGCNYDGDPAAVPNSSTEGVGGGLLKDFTQDQPIMTDFESLFLQAEAAQRGWLEGADPQALYESAVTQNYVYLYNNFGETSDPVADAAAYLSGDLLGVGAQVDVNWDASPNKLELIVTQKWAALNGTDWVMAYDDYRRTGYPTSQWLSISHSPAHIQPVIPIRYLYPQVEINTNGKNVPPLGTGAQFSAPIFWDK